MSLLMDALRKAEQQKQNAGTAGLSLEPRPDIAMEPPSPTESITMAVPGKSAPEGLPELPSRLADLDEQFIAHAAQAPLKKNLAKAVPEAPPQPTPLMARESSPEASPEAARKLFDAKLPAPKSNRNLAIAVTLLALIAGIGIGGYIWWEMQPKSSLVAASPAPAPVATTPIQPPSPPAPPAPQTPQAPVAAAAALPPLAVVPVAVPPAPTIATAAAQPADDSEDEPPKAAAPKPRPPAPAVATADFPVRVQTAPKKVDPAIEQAYLAFNRGDTEQAQAAWKKALARDPRNTDALHGMAALALRDKQHDLAANYYLRALENNPRDALALSGLMALKAPTDMLQAESRLKLLLAEQPDSPHLNFALGNLYTRNQRWAEAQQSFFRAHTADPANPDYLFNLAVSLDQLHQPRLAVQHYGKALEAAAQQPAGFDADQVAVRIKALQSLPSRQP